MQVYTITTLLLDWVFPFMQFSQHRLHMIQCLQYVKFN